MEDEKLQKTFSEEEPSKDTLNHSQIEEEIQQEIKPANKKLTIFNFILIVIIFVGLFIYMVCVDGMDNIITVLHQVDYKWVLGGLGCLLITWICETITLHLPMKKMYPHQTITNSIKVTMIGLLFNNETPFSSGGQPMQAYELTKTGKRVSDSLSALAIKFIITQIALVVTTLVVVAIEFDFFANLMQNFVWLAIVGFAINILAIIVVIIAGIKKRAITIFTTPIIKFLGKIRIIKNPDKTIEKLDESIDNFRGQFQFMRKQKKLVLLMFLTAVIQSLAYYSITYMVYRAFGNYGISFWQIIPVQAFLLLLMTFIPTPGSGLGAEGGFLLLFNSIFKEGTINMSILFWRIYTFYLPIIIGAFFLIPTKKNKELKIDKQGL